MYVVLQDFTDKNTERIYRAGETFDAEGVTKRRINALLGNKHRTLEGPIIREVAETVEN
jgi:hypothetical protein